LELGLDRRATLAVSLGAGLAIACGSAAPCRITLAPADEYFGRTHMSPLEITNRIGDAERHGASYRGLMTTQSAIEDWTRKYPDDPWIPQREYRMSHLFARLHSHDGDAEASQCRTFMRTHFPGDKYTIASEHETHPTAKAAAKKKHHFLGVVY
jgi:hypothetical protein